MVEASVFHVAAVLERLEREHGRLNIYGERVVSKSEARLNEVCLVVLQEATQPQRNDPQLLVACAVAVYSELGWFDAINTEGFRRQFQRYQNELNMYAPDEEGRKMREEKRLFVQSKNKKWSK